MILYFTFLFLPLLAHYVLPTTNKNKILVGGITMLFFCFGYMTGSDWRTYELFYSNPVNILVSASYFEPGFILLNNILRTIGVEFWHWFILTKCVTYIIWLRFFDKYFNTHFFLVLFFFLGCYGSSVFIDNPFRNIIAVSVFLLAYQHIEKRNLLKFIIYMLIGLSLHRSTLFIIPFYFLGRVKLSTNVMIGVFVTSDLLFLSNIDFVKNALVTLGNQIPLLAERVNAYFIEDSEYSKGNPFSFGNLLRSILFFIIIFKRNSFEERFGPTFFNFIFYSFVSYKLAMSISILGRLNLYFIPFYCIAIIYLLYISSRELKLGTYGAVLLLAFYSMYTTITSTYKYLPYTNYLFYGTDPGYLFRYNYNFYNSPYSDDTHRAK